MIITWIQWTQVSTFPLQCQTETISRRIFFLVAIFFYPQRLFHWLGGFVTSAIGRRDLQNFFGWGRAWSSLVEWWVGDLQWVCANQMNFTETCIHSTTLLRIFKNIFFRPISKVCGRWMQKRNSRINFHLTSNTKILNSCWFGERDLCRPDYQMLP